MLEERLLKENSKKKVEWISFIFIMCYMFYVILISLLINFVLEPVLEPLYILFKNTNPFWNLNFWLGTIIITIVYAVLNTTMLFLTYKTSFLKWHIKKEDKEKFLRVVGLIFPIGLFLFSYVTEKEFFPLIINTILQIILTYQLQKQIKTEE